MTWHLHTSKNHWGLFCWEGYFKTPCYDWRQDNFFFQEKIHCWFEGISFLFLSMREQTFCCYNERKILCVVIATICFDVNFFFWSVFSHFHWRKLIKNVLFSSFLSFAGEFEECVSVNPVYLIIFLTSF